MTSNARRCCGDPPLGCLTMTVAGGGGDGRKAEPCAGVGGSGEAGRAMRVMRGRGCADTVGRGSMRTLRSDGRGSMRADGSLLVYSEHKARAGRRGRSPDPMGSLKGRWSRGRRPTYGGICTRKQDARARGPTHTHTHRVSTGRRTAQTGSRRDSRPALRQLCSPHIDPQTRVSQVSLHLDSDQPSSRLRRACCSGGRGV